MRISIIIPVYNSENFLEKCLLSVCNQTHTDFECILVDDGSSDSSGRICDEWCAKDCRFRVIHQVNKGVSVARNTGLTLCNTEWVTFIDSDDWINDDFIKLMVDEIQNYPHAEVVVSSSHTHYSDRVSHECVMDNSGCYSFDNKNHIVVNELLAKYKIMAPWGKLYRTSVIKSHNIQFPVDISFGEDLIFNVAYFSHINVFAVAKAAIYNYTVREGSLSKNVTDSWSINYPQWVGLYNMLHSKNIESRIISNTVYEKLWSIIEESLFTSKDLRFSLINEYKYIKSILAIPEINDTRFLECDYNCSSWIKYIVTHRHPLMFVFINRYLLKKQANSQ